MANVIMNYANPPMSGGQPLQSGPHLDLSHLTDQERQTIESVMRRQQQQEQEEAEVLK